MEPLNQILDRKIYSLTTDYLPWAAATTWRSIAIGGRHTGSQTRAGLEWGPFVVHIYHWWFCTQFGVTPGRGFPRPSWGRRRRGAGWRRSRLWDGTEDRQGDRPGGRGCGVFNRIAKWTAPHSCGESAAFPLNWNRTLSQVHALFREDRYGLPDSMAKKTHRPSLGEKDLSFSLYENSFRGDVRGFIGGLVNQLLETV